MTHEKAYHEQVPSANESAVVAMETHVCRINSRFKSSIPRSMKIPFVMHVECSQQEYH